MARLWDALGLCSTLIFAVGLAVLLGPEAERAAARAAGDDPGAPGDAVVAGEEWLGLYFQDTKIGLTHVTRTAQPEGGFRYAVTSTLKLATLGVDARAELDLTAEMDAERALTAFELSLHAGPQTFRGQGTVNGTRLHLRLNTGGAVIERDLDLPARPVLRDLMGPALSRLDLTPGARHRLPGFDPWTQSADPVEVEILGPEPLALMGTTVEAVRVRERVAGLTLDAWINRRGEMLRQELPLGVVALRQSEEEARWGMAGEAGISLADAVEIPVAALPRPPRELRRLSLRVELGEGAALPGLDRPPTQRLAGDVLERLAEAPPSGAPLPLPRALLDAEARAALQPDAVVQADHAELRRTAQEIVARAGAAGDTAAATRALADWIHAELRFERRGGVPSALETLHERAGDCTEVSVLQAAFGRALGVPTRLVFGLVYTPTPAPRFAWHAWNEVRGASGWFSVDATWGQMPADVGHVALVAGEWTRQGELLGAMRRLRLTPLAWE